MNKFKVGFGYDVHQLVSGRDLIIGGVSINFHKGSLGHSDADVLLHALADALLGAAGLGDIGTHFPDTALKFQDFDSKLILKEVFMMIWDAGYQVNNIDVTVLLQEPKIKEYIPEMKSVIASILNMDLSDVSVKATTTEHLGYIGNSEGLAAFAIVSIIG